jgi:hypothetical protein
MLCLFLFTRADEGTPFGFTAFRSGQAYRAMFFNKKWSSYRNSIFVRMKGLPSTPLRFAQDRLLVQCFSIKNGVPTGTPFLCG